MNKEPKLTPSQVVDEWIKAKCELKGKCLIKSLFASYKAFTEQHGYPSLSKHDMSYRLRSEGFKPYRTQAMTFATGITLKDQANNTRNEC